MCTTEEYILSFHILLGSWNQTRACISFSVSSLKERNVLCIKKNLLITSVQNIVQCVMGRES